MGKILTILSFYDKMICTRMEKGFTAVAREKSEIKNNENGLYVGIEIGDTHDRYETFVDYIKENYDLEKLGFVLIHCMKREIGEERFLEWARFFKENDIHFAFLYTQQRGAPEGKESQLTKETVAKIKETAGELFVGDMIGETGGLMSWFEEYFRFSSEEIMMPTDIENLTVAKEKYIDRVAKIVALDRKFDVEDVLSVEATTASRYNFEAGVDVSFMEMLCGDPEIMMSSVRGASRAYGRKAFGAHIAHEWYGGLRVDDPMKYKRLRLAYRYAYLSGANYIYPESGDFGIRAYGFMLDKDHEFCELYRKEWSDFADLVASEPREGEGPKVSLAFVQGINDPYGGWGNKTIWNQFGREAWGYSDAENSWRILDTITRRDKWHCPENFGDIDRSAHPAYGQYDLLPAEAPADVMKKYDTLIFAGRNTMTEDTVDKLCEFVSDGGTLFITAAHLSSADSPEAPYSFAGGKLCELLGFVPTGETFKRNSGYKFVHENLFDDILYPAAKDGNCDPILPGGFVEYMKIDAKTAVPAALLSDCFVKKEENVPALMENRYGKGRVITLLTVNYPGNNAVYPVYSRIVKCISDAVKRKADVKVCAPDDITYAVYETDTKVTVYLLNTNYDCKMIASVSYNENEKETVISPMELTAIRFAK